MNQFDAGHLKKGADVFRALRHPFRLELLSLIDHSPGITVGEICKRLKVNQSMTSQQLSILKSAGVVIAKHSGKHRMYFIHEEHVSSLQNIASKIVGLTSNAAN